MSAVPRKQNSRRNSRADSLLQSGSAFCLRLVLGVAIGCAGDQAKTCNKNVDNNYEMMYITGIKRIAEQKGA